MTMHIAAASLAEVREEQAAQVDMIPAARETPEEKNRFRLHCPASRILSGQYIAAGRQMWKQDCSEHGREAGSPKSCRGPRQTLGAACAQ